MIAQAAFFKKEKQFFGAAFSLEHPGKVRELTAEGAANQHDRSSAGRLRNDKFGGDGRWQTADGKRQRQKVKGKRQKVKGKR